MNLPMVSSLHSLGFTQHAIDRLNDFILTKMINLDNSFYKEYLNFIKKISVDDAKQLIHIYKISNGFYVSFYYQSDEDILIDLTNIISGFKDPTYEIKGLFNAKLTYMLPINLHEWIKNDLSAMLYFIHNIPNSLTNRTFLGGNEFKHFFMNFVQFNVIENVGGNFSYKPIEFVGGFNIPYWISNYENYKKYYLNNVTPDKNFKWLESCSEEQLESLLDNLSEKNLRILDGIFYPKTFDDKVALIKSSLNSISIEKLSIINKKYKNEPYVKPLNVNKKQIIKIRSYDGFYIFVNKMEGLDFDNEKFEGVGISISSAPLYTSDDCLLFEPNINYYFTKVGKVEETILSYGREYNINQLKNNIRKKRYRSNEELSREEQTVTIMKKNMQKLTYLAKFNNQSINKYINKIIEKEYENIENFE